MFKVELNVKVESTDIPPEKRRRTLALASCDILPRSFSNTTLNNSSTVAFYTREMKYV